MKKIIFGFSFPFTNNSQKDGLREIATWTDKATDKINELEKENKELKEKVETLEKIIEVLQAQIDEIKKDQEQNKLIAQIEQPPKYNG